MGLPVEGPRGRQVPMMRSGSMARSSSEADLGRKAKGRSQGPRSGASPRGRGGARVGVHSQTELPGVFQQNPIVPPMAYPTSVYVSGFSGRGGGLVCVGQSGEW